MAVRIYQQDEIKGVISQGGLNPNPVFPQWNPMDIYPNQYWGSTVRHKARRKFRMIYLENEYLKVGFNLEIGGRPWSLYDKLAQRHAMEYASDVWSYVGGFARSYTAGGMEVNYPRAHSATTRLPREHRTRRNSDGSASVIISEYERKWRTRWSVTYTLRPGRAVLEMTVRIYNRTPFDSRCMYWGNCGIPMNDDVEFIIPEYAGAMHGKEEITFSWPMWQGKSQAFWKNTPQALGLYMLEKQEPYFGYYDHAAECGLAHYSDVADLPGMKYWSWGSGWIGREAVPPTVHPDGMPYGEIQSGRVVIQEHLDRVPPETEQLWTEYWYPVRGTGRFHGVGPGAVIAIQPAPVKSDAKSTKLKINVLGTGQFSDAHLDVTCGSCKGVQKKISLSPESVTEVPVTLGCGSSVNNIIVATVTDRAGLVLGQARLNPPAARDSWTEIPEIREDVQRVSAEEIFFQAEVLNRDWMKHDTRSKYDDALAVDPGLAKAHLELAKLDIDQGCYESAVEHINKACQRDEDSFEIKYFLGLALDLSGNEQAAQHAYELACRYDYEGRARIRLAEISVRQRNFHHALSHLERLRSMSPRLTRPRGLLAACLRHLNRSKDALAEIKAAMEIDPTDTFLQVEAMLISGDGKAARKALLEQVDSFEPPILETAFDYGNAGMYQDALFATRILPKPGPLTLLYRAWLQHKLGRSSTAVKTLTAACKLAPIGQHPWRLEMFSVLGWAIETLPDNARLHYYLGMLKMARDCDDQALSLWEKAQKLGEKCHILYASMGYYQMNVTGDMSQAMNYFRKAEKLQPNDRYVKAAIGEIMNRNGQHAQAIKYLGAQDKMINESFIMASPLFDACLATKQYDKIDKLCQSWGRNKISSFPQLPNRFIQQGLELIDVGKYQQAIDILLRGTEHFPPCLNPRNPRPVKIKIERIYYHIGRCFEKLGQIDKAKQYWLDAINVENVIAWEPPYTYAAWRDRYYQALCHLKLGNTEQANIIFDAIDAVAKNPMGLPSAARRDLMDLVVRGRLADEDAKDPFTKEAEVETIAEY